MIFSSVPERLSGPVHPPDPVHDTAPVDIHDISIVSPECALVCDPVSESDGMIYHTSIVRMTGVLVFHRLSVALYVRVYVPPDDVSTVPVILTLQLVS